jgi:hypothetical protein
VSPSGLFDLIDRITVLPLSRIEPRPLTPYPVVIPADISQLLNDMIYIHIKKEVSLPHPVLGKRKKLRGSSPQTNYTDRARLSPKVSAKFC